VPAVPLFLVKLTPGIWENRALIKNWRSNNWKECCLYRCVVFYKIFCLNFFVAVDTSKCFAAKLSPETWALRQGFSTAWLVCCPGGMLCGSYGAVCTGFLKTDVQDSYLKNIQEQPLGSDALPNSPT